MSSLVSETVEKKIHTMGWKYTGMSDVAGWENRLKAKSSTCFVGEIVFVKMGGLSMASWKGDAGRCVKIDEELGFFLRTGTLLFV